MARREAFGKPGPVAARGFSMSFYRFVFLVVCRIVGSLAGKHTLPDQCGSVLQLAFERLNLLGKGAVVARQIFDFADRMKHSGVVAPAEAAADFGQ